MSDGAQQYWVRNQAGKVWGPVTPASLEMLVINGLVAGEIQLSTDGRNYADAFRFPEVASILPRQSVRAPAPRATEMPTIARSVSAAPPAAVAAPPVVLRASAGASAAPTQPTQAAAASGVPASGDLKSFSPLRLYYLAATAGLSGRLELDGGEAAYGICFKKGSPEAIDSSVAAEGFGPFLVQKGVLTQPKLDEALWASAGQGGDLVKTLFGLGLLSPADAFRFIGEHAAGLFPRALALDKGTFRFDPAAPPPSSAMPLGDRWAIACSAVRALPLPTLKVRLGARAEQPIMKSGGRVELAQLKLSPQETRAAAAFDGVRSLATLCAASSAESDAIVRTAFLFEGFELISFVEPRPAAAPPPAGPPKVAPAAPPAAARPASPPVAPRAATPAPRPASPPVAPRVATPAPRPASPPVAPRIATPAPRPAPVVAARPSPPAPTAAAAKPATSAPPPASKPSGDLESVRAFAEGLKGKNHFQVLGVAENAAVAQIKAAYFQLAREYHPDTVAPDSPAELGQLKATIFGLINDAYRVLADDKQRAAYLDEVKAGGSDEKMDVGAIFAAEEAFQKGCILVKVRKYDEALKMLEEAVALNDAEGEFWAWRAWARFLVAQDKNAAKGPAMKDLDTAMKKNPRCAQTYFFAGQVCKLTGDSNGALKWFKKTVENDPNHIDAQREMRLASKK